MRQSLSLIWCSLDRVGRKSAPKNTFLFIQGMWVLYCSPVNKKLSWWCSMRSAPDFLGLEGFCLLFSAIIHKKIPQASIASVCFWSLSDSSSWKKEQSLLYMRETNHYRLQEAAGLREDLLYLFITVVLWLGHASWSLLPCGLCSGCHMLLLGVIVQRGISDLSVRTYLTPPASLQVWYSILWYLIFSSMILRDSLLVTPSVRKSKYSLRFLDSLVRIPGYGPIVDVMSRRDWAKCKHYIFRHSRKEEGSRMLYMTSAYSRNCFFQQEWTGHLRFEWNAIEKRLWVLGHEDEI